ncbi:hypothetical protein C2G38_2208077 [Gigaspora rosea]|uniref:Uncharacterized protein n=1 Tax=Gigaspora rosea TaxID=44941 RepID=A0A397UHD3_9GLOM|nr:hypothetical protein C2G38_2208077 [Gigaspora rosea]
MNAGVDVQAVNNIKKPVEAYNMYRLQNEQRIKIAKNNETNVTKKAIKVMVSIMMTVTVMVMVTVKLTVKINEIDNENIKTRPIRSTDLDLDPYLLLIHSASNSA